LIVADVAVVADGHDEDDEFSLLKLAVVQGTAEAVP